ncbi:MAG: radical SAM protein [Oscillospiraceae bacterium]|nr:radical SAM protein [Oscillospiraceae bacterium]
MRKHYNIPVFITHSGCRNDCVFCNQKIITGQSESSGEKEIRETIEKFIDIIYKNIDRIDDNYNNSVGTEIAFFGGSFTGLEKSQMIKFLEIANEYIEKHKIINGIRISTRPDYISREITDILLKYNVKSIELGIQSMFDEVLNACKRGCTVENTKKACEIIKSSGINLTGQMMLGLPGSNRERDIKTAEELVNLGIDSSRIYPTVILRDTQLYNMYKSNKYEPLSLDEAIFRAKKIKNIFDFNKIEILRMGLCSSDINNSDIIAGAYHPAFGELVESEIIYDKIVDEISGYNPRLCGATPFSRGQKKEAYNPSPLLRRGCRPQTAGVAIIIRANKKNMSKVMGHKKKNISKLKEKFNFKNIKIIEDNNINLYKIEITEN